MILGILSANISAFPKNTAFAQEFESSDKNIHPWKKYLRGFRVDHNFAILAGLSNSIWQVKKFGTLRNYEFANSGVFTRFHYNYHFPIYFGFGYTLGSAFGYHFESSDKRSPFRPKSAFALPGLSLGLTQNISEVIRVGIGAQAYLERHDGISEQEDSEPEYEISITMQAYEIYGYVDVFYDISWALQLGYHIRELQFVRPAKALGFPVDANLKKREQWIGLGILYHLI
jgi:hypothetical protein